MRSAAAEAGLAVLAYCCCSVSMILLNKLVMSTHHINFPLGLLFFQNIGALLLVVGAKASGLIHYPDFDGRVARRWLPLTLVFVAMLFTSMKSLSTMSVAVQTILKNLSTVLTAVGESYFFGSKLSPGMLVSFAMMFLGAYLGAAHDQWVTAEGLFWTVANIILSSAYLLYMKTLLSSVSDEIGRFGPVFYNNLLSLPFLLFPSLAQLDGLSHAIREASVPALLCLTGMVFVGSVMTFATFWCVQVTSPTTYAVTGALNKIPLAVLGMVVFGHMPTPMGLLGIVCALAGGMVYTWIKLPRAKSPAPTSPVMSTAPEGKNERRATTV